VIDALLAYIALLESARTPALTVNAMLSAQAAAAETLTARELEVARLAANEKKTRAIASALVISENTVETHLKSIYGKLGVSSRIELARAVESR